MNLRRKISIIITRYEPISVSSGTVIPTEYALLMDLSPLYILVISFFATLIRSTFGFGESLIAVPIFILFLPIPIAVPLSVLLSIFIAVVVVVQDHKKIHFNSAKWLIIFALPGIPIGIILLIYGSEALVKIALGSLVVLYALYSLLAKNSFRLKQDHKLWLFVCGLLSGIFGGAYGINGPPLVLYGNMRQWSATHFRATLQAYFLVASSIGMVGYAAKDLLTRVVFVDFLIALPAAIPALFLGRYLNHRLKDDSFFKYIYLGLILTGAFLILDATR